jgi:hypothetical protein
MATTGIRLLHLLTLILAIWGQEIWAEPGPLKAGSSSSVTEMRVGQSYRAGTRVRAPGGTASFSIPQGWRGEPLDEMAAILLVSEKESGFVLVFATLNQTEEDLAALLGEPQPITDSLVFEPVGAVARQGNRLTASYVAGNLIGRGVAVVGPSQQGILFLHGRPRKEQHEALSFLTQLADQVQFTPVNEGEPPR